MTVPIETSRVQYVGNGVTTAFSTQWYFLSAAHVRVRLTPPAGTETVLTEGVHYTVTAPARGSGAAGTVTFLAPPVAGAAVVIERDVSLVQTTALRIAGGFEPETHEDALDYQMMALQEVARSVTDLEVASGSVTLAAGAGLYATGSSPVTLHVGDGEGLVAEADSVSVAFETSPLELAILGSEAVAASAGAAGTVPRADHRHMISTAIPGACSVGAAAALGTSFALARADHVHSMAAPAAPADVTAAAAAAGSSTAAARADHKHNISTAAAVTLTDASNAEGSSSALARADHTHSHGVRGGGTLHAVATTAAAGFMSSADKAKLDGLAPAGADELFTTGVARTGNTTPTLLMEWTPDNATGEAIEVLVVAKVDAAAQGGSYARACCVVRHDNTTSLVGAVVSRWADQESVAGWDVTVSVASPKVQVFVTGSAAVVNWRGIARRVRAAST